MLRIAPRRFALLLSAIVLVAASPTAFSHTAAATESAPAEPAPTETAPAQPSPSEPSPTPSERGEVPPDPEPTGGPDGPVQEDPGGNSATIVVTVGGTRTSTSTKLEGVVLALYTDDGNRPGSRLNDSWARCTSDAQGECLFWVPETQSGGCLLFLCNPDGANRDRRFWVVQESAPAGWRMNEKLAVGGGEQKYAFRTGGELRSGSTYRSGADFMTESGQGSSGVWQNSLQNTPLRAACSAGLSVALVLDLSTSVGRANATGSLKTAAKGMVDSLAGTDSSLALFTFASTAPRTSTPAGQNHPSMNIDADDNAETIKSRIDAYETGGETNWDRGLWQVAQANEKFDLVVVITDDTPTLQGGQRTAGSTTRFIDMENAIFSANAVKAKGSRLLAVGVGPGVSGAGSDLAAISGPTAYSKTGPVNRADYAQTSWTDLAGLLARAAKGATCRSDITITKQTIAHGTTAATPGGSGWTFDVTPTTGTTLPANTQTTDATSAVRFDLNSTTGDPMPVEVTEVLTAAQSDNGWKLETIACRTNGETIRVEGDTVTVAPGDSVACTVTNKQVLKPEVTMAKQAWDTPTAAGLPTAKEIPAGAKVPKGRTITWTYTVKNAGKTVLGGVVVTDDKLPDDAVTCPKSTLSVGESMRCTASGTVTPR